MSSKEEPLLSVRGLSIDFHTERGHVRAVDEVSFDVAAGESVGLVGESGCGKSLSSLAILRLVPSPPGKIVGGEIHFGGCELLGLGERAMRRIRGNEIAMIFQEPATALNPVYTIGQQMLDVIRQHQGLSRQAARAKAIHQLQLVGIPSPERRIDSYPHQLSGGMRQRVMIAMALSCGPKLLIADEPTSALDVTTQAQVLAEMAGLQERFKMAILLVSHDLGVIAETCSKVIVMYCGRVVEIASVREIFASPRHPYTRGLLAAMPRIRPDKLPLLPTIEGAVSDLRYLPPGCSFAGRCLRASELCRQEQPPLRRSGDRQVACFHPGP